MGRAKVFPRAYSLRLGLVRPDRPPSNRGAAELPRYHDPASALCGSARANRANWQDILLISLNSEGSQFDAYPQSPVAT